MKSISGTKSLQIHICRDSIYTSFPCKGRPPLCAPQKDPFEIGVRSMNQIQRTNLWNCLSAITTKSSNGWSAENSMQFYLPNKKRILLGLQHPPRSCETCQQGAWFTPIRAGHSPGRVERAIVNGCPQAKRKAVLSSRTRRRAPYCVLACLPSPCISQRS